MQSCRPKTPQNMLKIIFGGLKNMTWNVNDHVVDFTHGVNMTKHFWVWQQIFWWWVMMRLFFTAWSLTENCPVLRHKNVFLNTKKIGSGMSPKYFVWHTQKSTVQNNQALTYQTNFTWDHTVRCLKMNSLGKMVGIPTTYAILGQR